MPDSLHDLAQQLDQFAMDRDWQQFHSRRTCSRRWSLKRWGPLEHFQWLKEEQSRALSPRKREAVDAAVADVLLYLIQLAGALGIDPIAAAQAKLKLNAQKSRPTRAR
jgi:NTP pyrophosphatase (non-canonical NTP hydrolase)